MDIALLAEGTYPYHPGGVSVCVTNSCAPRPPPFDIYSIIGGNDHEPSWELPDNVIGLHPIQLWGGAPSSRQSKASSPSSTPFLTTGQLHGRSQRRARLPRGAPAPVRALARTPLTGALQSKESLEILLAPCSCRPTNRRLAGTAASATVSDARIALELIEHQLRRSSCRPQGGHLPRHRKRPLRAPRPRAYWSEPRPLC